MKIWGCVLNASWSMDSCNRLAAKMFASAHRTNCKRFTHLLQTNDIVGRKIEEFGKSRGRDLWSPAELRNLQCFETIAWQQRKFYPNWNTQKYCTMDRHAITKEHHNRTGVRTTMKRMTSRDPALCDAYLRRKMLSWHPGATTPKNM